MTDLCLKNMEPSSYLVLVIAYGGKWHYCYSMRILDSGKVKELVPGVSVTC